MREADYSRLERYVPKALIPFFEQAEHDSDGYWFRFSEYVEFPNGESFVHGNTIRACRDAMKGYEIIGEEW